MGLKFVFASGRAGKLSPSAKLSRVHKPHLLRRFPDLGQIHILTTIFPPEYYFQMQGFLNVAQVMIEPCGYGEPSQTQVA